MKKLVVIGTCHMTCPGHDARDREIENPAHPALWVNQCHREIKQWQDLELINLARNGANNLWIFEKAVQILAENFGRPEHKRIKYLVIGWAPVGTMQLQVGVETYDTTLYYWLPSVNNISTNQASYTKKTLRDHVRFYKKINHPHNGILKVVQYVNTLATLAQAQDIGIVFTNMRLPWDTDYFLRQSHQGLLPSDFTKFTQKEILFCDNRDDQESIQLYNKIHDEYDQAGGIHEHLWANLYSSFSDGEFTGSMTRLEYQDIFTEKIKQYMTSQTL